MKRILSILSAILLMVLALAGCSSEPVDVSQSLSMETVNGVGALTGYEGNHSNITLPDTVNGKEIEMIAPSFAQGKSITKVVLPKMITAFVKTEQGVALCSPNVDKAVKINQGNAAKVYCEFFGVSKITVNNVEYSLPKEPEQMDLSGLWKHQMFINGERYCEEYTFENGKVTVKTDSTTFEGTYSIDGNKVTLSIDDDSATFERVGDDLICWELEITLTTKELNDYAQTTDSGWDYVITASGTAQLIGYHGNEEIISIPSRVDGYDVGSLNSCMAQTYDFKAFDEGIWRFNMFYFDSATGNYIVYGDFSTEGHYIVHVREHKLRGDFYCRFFNTDKITVGSGEHKMEFTSSRTEPLTEKDVLGIWAPYQEAGYDAIKVALHKDGIAELHHYEENDTEVCARCIKANYTINGNTVNIIFDGGRLALDFIGSTVVSWSRSSFLDGTYSSNSESLEFVPMGEYDGVPFLHVSPASLIGKWQMVDSAYKISFDFRSDGTVVRHEQDMDRFAEGTYTFDGDQATLLMEDGVYILSVSVDKDGKRLEDAGGNIFEKEEILNWEPPVVVDPDNGSVNGDYIIKK